MENQIEKFDPSKLMDGVRDRIKATFVSLIPDDQWEQLVKKEIDAFFETQKEYQRVFREESVNGYGSIKKIVLSEANVSPFRAIVWDMCIEKCNKILKESLFDEYFDKISYGDLNPNEKLKEIIAKAAPQAAVMFFERMAEKAAMNLRQDIINHRI